MCRAYESYTHCSKPFPRRLIKVRGVKHKNGVCHFAYITRVNDLGPMRHHLADQNGLYQETYGIIQPEVRQIDFSLSQIRLDGSISVTDLDHRRLHSNLETNKIYVVPLLVKPQVSLTTSKANAICNSLFTFPQLYFYVVLLCIFNFHLLWLSALVIVTIIIRHIYRIYTTTIYRLIYNPQLFMIYVCHLQYVIH